MHKDFCLITEMNGKRCKLEYDGMILDYPVYSNGKVRQALIKTGIQDDTYIQVLSGLKAGEEVVSRPFTAIAVTLKDSMKVEKVDKEKLFEAPVK